MFKELLLFSGKSGQSLKLTLNNKILESLPEARRTVQPYETLADHVQSVQRENIFLGFETFEYFLSSTLCQTKNQIKKVELIRSQSYYFDKFIV